MDQKIQYSVGIQSFQRLIEEGEPYVDKTAFVADLVNTGKYYYLSRPRGFGKSLLLSTFHAYFDGKRELFKGLALDSADVDWTPTPVFYFNLLTGDYYTPRGLSCTLSMILKKYESLYGVDASDFTGDGSLPLRFGHLIRTVAKQTGRKVAILVDEFYRPLLDLEEGSEIYKRNESLLDAFFGNLKSMDRYIRFALLTDRVSYRVNSIYSGLNNLSDISLHWDYADICGWTEEELVSNYRPGIEALAEKREESFDATIKALRGYYDGYKFHEDGHRLYNPIDILKALNNKDIKPYFVEISTRTPILLAELIKKQCFELYDLHNIPFSSYDLRGMGAASQMLQKGYLTIDSYDSNYHEYKLRLPNREVEYRLACCLFDLYEDSMKPRIASYKFENDLYDGNPESFMQRLQTLLKTQPDLCSEYNYHTFIWLLCITCGLYVQTEQSANQEVLLPKYIYVFEFKYGKSVEEAKAQLHKRDYAGRYAVDPRPVYLIAANFSPETGLAWEIERMK